MNAQRLRVLLPSDVFPPRCGGAGWSAHALALALLARGHLLTAVVPQQGGRGIARSEALGVPTIRWGYQAPRLPFIQNYVRHERLWPRLAEFLATAGHPDPALAAGLPLVIHAQHVQVAMPAVLAGQRLGAPAVVTVRDHWPWDYFATGLHGDRLPYARQTWASLATDLVARLGPGRGVLALPALPYMLAHLRRRRWALRQAAAVIAVSDYVARRLEGIVAPERVHVIPNIVDIAAIEATIATPPSSVTPGQPYLLFVGKLERNKGAHLLIDIFRQLADHRPPTTDHRPPITDHRPPTTDHRPQAATEGLPYRVAVDGSQFSILNSQFSIPELIIAGSGPLRAELERELPPLGVRARFLDWADHDEVLRLMAGCTLLLFPSAWGEPLSRVLLEASACGASILAMPTGGTPNIIADGVSGALEPTMAGFARRLAALLRQPERRCALGATARRAARERFGKDVVVARMEELYRSLV